jgi:hemerythrin-like domain-containing protein
MRPSQIRERILGEHDTLREMVSGLAELANRFDPERDDAAAELRKAGFECLETFAAHLDTEDGLLIPVLATIPEEGPVLAERLRREHHEQRELLEFLVRRLEDNQRPTSLVVNELHNFAEYLRLDMSHEEATILREDLLRDDAGP